jgi:protoheme IX farnesyltransferase
VSLLPYLSGMSGLIYLLSAVILGLIFLAYAVRIYQNPDNKKLPWATFMYSVNYLMLLFVALLIDHYFLLTL